jgi:photosystem II stability/assembly factor-like uncharacterized protein
VSSFKTLPVILTTYLESDLHQPKEKGIAMRRLVVCLGALALRAGVAHASELPLPLLEPDRLVIAMAASGHHPGLVLVGTENRGLYRSSDAGKTWEILWQPYGGAGTERITDIEFDPHDPDRVYLTVHSPGNPDIESGVFRSTDRGRSWESVSHEIDHDTRVVTLDPAVPNLIYAGGEGTILRSSDAGESWEELTLGVNGETEDIAIDRVSGAIYVTAGHGSDNNHLLRSEDGGSTWIELTSRLPASAVVGNIAIDPSTPEIIYLAGFDGVYKSEDSGATWANTGLDWINDITIHPRVPGLAFAGVNSHSQQYGLYQTRDGGLSWDRLHTGDPFVLVVDPLDINALYAAILTSDGSQGWKIGVYRVVGLLPPTAVERSTWGDVKRQRGSQPE